MRHWADDLTRSTTVIKSVPLKLSRWHTYWHKLCTLPPPSHSRKRMAMLAVMSRRKNRLWYPIKAVKIASITASATPCFARYFRRKAATWRLNLTTKAPYRPYRIRLLGFRAKWCGRKEIKPRTMRTHIPQKSRGWRKRRPRRSANHDHMSLETVRASQF